MYVWSVFSFSWNESPYVYATVSGVRSQFLRSRGIPAFMCIDNLWQGSPNAVRSSEIREQWLAAAAGLCLAVALSACAGFFQYLGLMCDSGRAVFRVPSDKLCRPRDHMRQVLVEGVVPLSTLK